jgi:hypothetical protein
MTPERWNEVNDIAHDYEIEDFRNPKNELSAIHLLTAYYDELMNGGFSQYFSNMDSGYDFHEHHLLIEALKTAGMKEFIGMTKKAIKLNEKMEACREDDDERLEKLDEKLEKLYESFDDEKFINMLYSFADKVL